MASVLSTTGKNALLNSAATWPPTYASLHSGDPGGSGTSNELTGGTYARLPVTWTASTADSLVLTTTYPVFNVPAGSTVSYIGLWSAIAGDYLGCIDCTNEVYVGAGTYTFNTAAISL